MRSTLALIDGHYYAYRFFFGMPPLSGPDGHPTGVTFAFANLFLTLRQDPAITHWACVLDHPEDSFRHKLDQEYKAHRDPMPDPLRAQCGDLHELCAASGVPLIERAGFEADDIVATLAREAEAKGWDVRILTRDKDIDQVITDRIRTWDTFSKEGDGLRGPQELLADKGLKPEQVVDYLCMVGDSADNIGGIDGVGPKTAMKLLGEYGTLKELLKNSGRLKGKLKDNVEAFMPRLQLTVDLVTLRAVPEMPALDGLALDRAFKGDQAVYGRHGFRYARFFPEASQDGAKAVAKTAVRVVDAKGLGAFLERARQAKLPIALALEATDHDPMTADIAGLALATAVSAEEREAIYVPIAGAGEATVPWQSAAAALSVALADPATAVVAHDGKPLARLLGRSGVRITRLDGDTMLASWLLDPSRESHALGFLMRMFLGQEPSPPADPPLPRLQGAIRDAAIAAVAQVAGEEVSAIARLHRTFAPELAKAGLDGSYRDQELPIVLVLGRMEDAGIAVDAPALEAIQRNLQAYLDQVLASIRRVAGAKFNPGSPKQIGELLFDKLGLPVLQKTKSGPSTEAWVLEALRHQHELPDLILQYRELSKLIGTYVARLPEWINKETGRIHSRFRQTGTETGRLSSDQPNLQNIPKKRDLGREIRGAFVPTPGRLFIAADYSQIELRVLAHLSGDPVLRAAFAGDTDIHRFVAAQVNGIDEPSVTPKQRNAAKAVNFGIIYGQTAYGLSQTLGIAPGEAKKFIEGYFERFKGVRAYIDHTIDEATRRGYAETIAGRRRYIPTLGSGNHNDRLAGTRIALNSTIQGSAADLIKSAMLRLARTMPTGAQLILQIHDELLIEADVAMASQASQALTEAMTGAWKLEVPLVAQARSGATWLEVS